MIPPRANCRYCGTRLRIRRSRSNPDGRGYLGRSLFCNQQHAIRYAEIVANSGRVLLSSAKETLCLAPQR